MSDRSFLLEWLDVTEVIKHPSPFYGWEGTHELLEETSYNREGMLQLNRAGSSHWSALSFFLVWWRSSTDRVLMTVVKGKRNWWRSSTDRVLMTVVKGKRNWWRSSTDRVLMTVVKGGGDPVLIEC